jgi:acetyl-CoA acyltransferase
MFKAVIAGYSRSPFTMARKGELIDVKPVNLLAEVVSNLVSKTKVQQRGHRRRCSWLCFPNWRAMF